MATKFKAGDVLRATSGYTGKYLYEGIRATVEPDMRKVKVIDGPGKGRRLLANFDKFELWNGEEIVSTPTAKVKKGDKVKTLSLDQMRILFEEEAETFYFGDDIETYGNALARVVSVGDYDEDEESFVVDIEILDGDCRGCEMTILEKELNEFYEKGGKQFRLSYLDEDDNHHVKVIDAPTLEAAREKVGPIKQEFYHMSL